MDKCEEANSHRASALMFEWNTLVPMAAFTPSVSVNTDAGVKNQMDSIPFPIIDAGINAEALMLFVNTALNSHLLSES